MSRTNRIDGRGVQVFKDKQDQQYQAALGLEATAAIMRWSHENGEPWSGLGEFHVECEFHVPDLRRRDIDNMLKNVLDALSMVYNDDTQVVSVRMIKRLRREKPKTVVQVWRTEGHLDE